MECSIAFEQVPGRGLEIGGILLGRMETEENVTTFWVDGFRAIESEHRLGPSYLLSEGDFAHVRDEIARSGGGCVGIYRSQTRTKQLALDIADARLFGQCFPKGNALFLMLAPALSGAAFFSRADADLKCVREFGLGSGRIALHHDQPMRQARPRGRGQPARALPAPPAEVPAKWRPFGQWRVRYAAAMIAILFLGAAAGFLFRRAGLGPAPPKLIELKVQRAGSVLHVHWDPNSSALRGAARVVLYVQDGDYRSDRDLASSELRAGSAAYHPRSDEVFFRIDAYPAAPSAAGSVRVINSPGHAAILPPAAPPQVLPPPQVRPLPQRAAEPIPKEAGVTKGWLGMSLRPVTPAVAMASHLPQTYGFLITRVDAWSPARSSGLESGDIVLAVDGQRIADAQDLQLKIREASRRKTTTLAVFRDGAIRQIEVNIGEGAGRVAQSAAVTARP